MVPRTTRVSTRGGASADDMVGVLGCASTTRNGLLELEEPKAHMGVCVLNNRNNLTGPTRATGSHSASPTTRTGEGGRDSGELGVTGRVEEAERQKERGGDVLLYSPP
jgi:hypothetical protein